MSEDKVVLQVDHGSEGMKDVVVNAPSNSHKQIEQVAKGTTRKESIAGKIFSEFITCDLKTVAESAVNDILVPYAKDAILDMLHDSIDMLFNGGSTRRGHTSKTPTYVSYNSYYRQETKDSERRPDRRAGYDFKEVLFKTRIEAEEVVERMYDILETDGNVTVADFYSLAGIRSAYTDETYGWVNLRSCTVQKVRDGYTINLPKPKLL